MTSFPPCSTCHQHPEVVRCFGGRTLWRHPCHGANYVVTCPDEAAAERSWAPFAARSTETPENGPVSGLDGSGPPCEEAPTPVGNAATLLLIMRKEPPYPAGLIACPDCGCELPPDLLPQHSCDMARRLGTDNPGLARLAAREAMREPRWLDDAGEPWRAPTE